MKNYKGFKVCGNFYKDYLCEYFMAKQKYTKEEVLKQRPDLVEAKMKGLAEFIADGTLQLTHTSNFLQLLFVMAKNPNSLDPVLRERLQKEIEEANLDVNAYSVLKGVPRETMNNLMDSAFSIYKNLHDKYKIPYSKLLAPDVKY